MKSFLVALLFVAAAQASWLGDSTAIVGPSTIGGGQIAKGGAIVTNNAGLGVGLGNGIVSPGYIATSGAAVIAPATVRLGGYGLGGYGLGLGNGIGLVSGKGLGLVSVNGLGLASGYGVGLGLYH